MMPASLGLLSFVSPWVLAGLAALPAIWWLLRMTPPQRRTVAFPPTLLLLKIKGTQRTPAKSPWWLTALRMAVAACAILALAGPSLKAPSARGAAVTHPMLVVADNGWGAASRWEKRSVLAQQLASDAREAGQPLYLVTTAGPKSALTPLTPEQFVERWRALTPEAYAGDREAAAQALETAFSSKRGQFHVVWLADGLEDKGAAALRTTLSAMASAGAFEVVTDDAGSGALTISRSQGEGRGRIRLSVAKGESVLREGVVAAATLRGEKLGAAPFVIPADKVAAEVSIDLPLELANQVARFEIEGESSAGAVFLVDGRSQRRRVGVIATDDAERAQPLLSPSHYLERALTPFADVVQSRTANLETATETLLARNPSVMILSDVGRISGRSKDRLKAFVEKGGMLVRFAGPRLENGGDDLLPVALRQGGRTLGGAMTWTSPQKPAAFEQGSLFEGMAVPNDVTVSQQVLADPSRMPRTTAVAARLADGTPLVTASKLGAGQLVFFHVTANPDWSTLPLSGLFVDMLRKIVETSPLDQGSPPTGGANAETTASTASLTLKPWRLLDGFGRFEQPSDGALSVLSSKLPSSASAAAPAGLYGPQNATRAVNAIPVGATLAQLVLPDGARSVGFTEAKTMFLAPWLFFAALLLLLCDTLAAALLLGRRFKASPVAAAIAIIALVQGHAVSTARAGTAADEATKFAMQASLETRFAYVLTGNSEADRLSQAGLTGLSKVLSNRTAVEPGEPLGIDPVRDDLVFFPFIYWPVTGQSEPLTDAVLAKIEAYMKQGGLIVFDTKNEEALTLDLMPGGSTTPLSTLLGKLDLPPLQRVPDDHVLTKSFYLLQSFPGRWDNADLWVEAPRVRGADGGQRSVKTDGVSSIIVTSNDLAAAWAIDENERPMFAPVPGGEEQREMSYRVGVNIAMYALTGNYKADQVHVPAILDRLGH